MANFFRSKHRLKIIVRLVAPHLFVLLQTNIDEILRSTYVLACADSVMANLALVRDNCYPNPKSSRRRDFRDTKSLLWTQKQTLYDSSSWRHFPQRPDKKTVEGRVTGETASVQSRGKVTNTKTKHDVWIANIFEEDMIGLRYLLTDNCQVHLCDMLLYVGNDKVLLFSDSQPLSNSLSRIFIRRTIPLVLAIGKDVISGEL